VESWVGGGSGPVQVHPRCGVEDLAAPLFCGEAELCGRARLPGASAVVRELLLQTAQRACAPAIRPRLRFSAGVSARAPCSSAIRSNSPAVKAPRLSGRIVTVLGFALARSVREKEGDAGRVVFLEVAQGMTEDLSMS
jgi:hypothetical protein